MKVATWELQHYPWNSESPKAKRIFKIKAKGYEMFCRQMTEEEICESLKSNPILKSPFGDFSNVVSKLKNEAGIFFSKKIFD